MIISYSSKLKLGTLVGGWKTKEPFFSAEKGLLVCTDGHVLVTLPAKAEDGETSGSVPVKAFAPLLRKRKLGEPKASMHCGERVVVKDIDGSEASYPRTTDYVSWEKACETPREGRIALCLDATLLAKAQNALGCSFITIWLDPKDVGKALIVGSHYPKDGFALVMPARGADRSEMPSVEAARAQ